MKIAFFDFDGTITAKDSLAEFLKFGTGRMSYYLGLLALSPMLVCYVLKLIPNDKAKARLISYFFRGSDASSFKELAKKYSVSEIDRIIRPKAIEKIQWHLNEGHKVVMVSASMESWLKAWCAEHNMELVSTRLEFNDNKVTGRFATKNCYGIEKVNRIREAYDLDEYEYIYAYGDSSGDKEMLALADESFYKPFRD